jgi:hypothetical protein
MQGLQRDPVDSALRGEALGAAARLAAREDDEPSGARAPSSRFLDVKLYQRLL